ncbi:MAG: hypothetical protein ACI8XM_000459 [Haloarculaceae archaeon]|jgi:hypothetical protein
MPLREATPKEYVQECPFRCKTVRSQSSQYEPKMKMEFERRDDDQWHLVAANCGYGGTADEAVEIDSDAGFTRTDNEISLRLPAVDDPTWCDVCRDTVTERYTQASRPIEHWKVATTYRDIEWSEYDGAIDCCGWCQSDVETLIHDTRTDTLVCEVCAALYNSTATDIDGEEKLTDYAQLADEVEPIVVIDGEASQQTAARIDRRPYISLEAKRKYVTVTITLRYVDYQFTENAIGDLRNVFESYEARAFTQSDNKGGVEFEVTDHRRRRQHRPRQRIVVDGLFESDAHEFIKDVIPVVQTTSNWTYDPSDVSAQAVQRAIRERGRPGPAPVPREDAPAVTGQDDGVARHVSLSDKSISDGQIRAYVSDQAYRHGEALVDAGRIRTDHAGGHESDADGYDPQSGVGFNLWFENGEIVDHECVCGSSLDPCEHIAGALIALPHVAACYV